MKKINYSQSVNYNLLDPFKKLAQKMARQTSKNLDLFGLTEISQSRGESAFVWEDQNCYRALVIEGLGTKNLVADEVAKLTGKSYYQLIAKDTVAAIVNDIITVGALPQVINAYFGLGSAGWFSDKERSETLVEGWVKACNEAGATWGGGETPSLSGIINSNTIDLAGSCIGIIKPKNRLILGDKLTEGDIILLLESSGIHANGLSLVRAIADKLPEKYASILPDGKLFGEALLTPTHIYVNLIKDLFDQNIDIHYMVNITGHGWRKLMRANKEFTYIITQIPQPPRIFDFIQQTSGNTDKQMYATFNMGAGFAIYLPAKQVEKAQKIAQKHHLKSWKAGEVKKGHKQIIIEPKKITFDRASLEIK